MVYFSIDAAQAIAEDVEALKQSREELTKLAKQVLEQIRLYHYELNLIAPEAAPVKQDSVADVSPKNVLSVAFLRSRGQAAQIERMMGREEVASVNTVEARRHPVLELRLSPEYFTIELILSPDAWVDQQNLAGKLTVLRHRQEFYTLLQNFPLETRLGFWRGVHLSEMQLASKHFRHPRIMEEWMSTFHPNLDAFRVGRWFTLDDEDLTMESLLAMLRPLHELYQFVLWTSGNNFREFYTASK